MTTRKLPNGRPKYVVTKRDDGTNVLTIKRTADGDVGQYYCAVVLDTEEAQKTLKQDVHVHGNNIVSECKDESVYPSVVISVIGISLPVC